MTSPMEYSPRKSGKKNAQNLSGLGWIPDYPDLRDYSLNNENDIKNKLRFKTEERTGDVERLAQEVLKLLYNLVPQISTVTNGEKKSFNKATIDALKNKILGNIIFADVKAYKILRLKDENNPAQMGNHLMPNDAIEYDRLFIKQITELKRYIYIILSQRQELSKYDIFNSSNSSLEWMLKEVYDKDTELIIRNYQSQANITKDGIVGIETYINFLNEDFDKLGHNQQSGNQFLERFKFFSISAFLSNTAFKKILDLLLQDISTNNNTKQISSSSKFDIGSLTILKDNSNKLSNILSSNDLIFVYKYFSQDDFKIKEDDVIDILKNSFVIEPIISVIIKFMSPLAKNRSLTFDELLEKCLNNFKNIAKSINSDNIIADDQQVNHNIQLGYSQQELVKSAIFKVISLIKKDIKSIKSIIELFSHQNDLTKNRYVNTIYLYLLVLEYLHQFSIVKDITEDIDIDRPNIFDKEEVFEINIETLRLNNYADSINNTKSDPKAEKLKRFPHLDLHIPIISGTLLQELEKCQQNPSINQHLFFMLPSVVDLTFWFPPVRDQGSLNSCTAFAAISLLEYFEKRNFGKSLDASPLFLYNVVRKKMNIQGDVGASIRETMKAMALFGVPPEESWAYEEDKVDVEPPPYCYAYAQNYKTLKYFFLDYAGIAKESLLFQIKAVLAAGFPCIFGFTIYTSAYERINYRKGYIPYPDPNIDKVVGGHTAVVVGYDDYQFMRCAERTRYSQGAFLVRNSWGTKWGINGYGWLPYDYVLAGLTAGWWSLLKADWFDESNFGPAAMGGEGRKETPP